MQINESLLVELPEGKKTDDLLIAMGDFHGHYPAYSALERALDAKYSIFTGRSKLREGVTIVTTGDYIDRGNLALPLIKRLITLKNINPDQAIELIGNHELLALEYLDHAKKINKMLSEGSSLKGLKVLGGFEATNGFELYFGNLHGYNGGAEFLKEFGDDDVSAFESYVKRMSKKGNVGKWMRLLKPIHVQDFNGTKILFSHSDIPKELWSGPKIKKFAHDYKKLLQVDTGKLGGSENKYERYSEGEQFWNRGFSDLTKYEMDIMLNNLGVDFVVVGHTPNKQIKKYGDRIFDIDVGMCPAYGENYPTAIIFKDDGIYEFIVDTSKKMKKVEQESEDSGRYRPVM